MNRPLAVRRRYCGRSPASAAARSGSTGPTHRRSRHGSTATRRPPSASASSDVTGPTTLEPRRSASATTRIAARTYAVVVDVPLRQRRRERRGHASRPRPRSRVGAKADATFTVTLRASTRPSSGRGPSTAAATAQTPTLLSPLEYDGYVWLDDQGTTADNSDPAHLPWQVLPRAAASRRARLRRDLARQRRPRRGPRAVLPDGDQRRRSGVVRPGRQRLGRGLQGRRRGDLPASRAILRRRCVVDLCDRRRRHGSARPTPTRRSCSSSTSISTVTGQPDYAVYNRDQVGDSPRCPTAAT